MRYHIFYLTKNSTIHEILETYILIIDLHNFIKMYTIDNLLSMRNMKLQFSSHSTDMGQLSFSPNGALCAPHNRTPSSLLFAEWDPEADHQTDGERGTHRLLGRAGEISLRRAPPLPGAALRKGGRALFRGRVTCIVHCLRILHARR